MGHWTVLNWTHLVCVTGLTCLTFWCCTKTAQFIYETLYPVTAELSDLGSNSRTSSRSRNGSTIQKTDQPTFTLALTLLTTVFFNLSLTVYLIGHILVMNDIKWVRNDNTDQSFRKYTDVFVCSAILQYYGYSCQLWLFFRRIEYAFQHSRFRMSSFQFKLFHFNLILYAIIPTVYFLADWISGKPVMPAAIVGISTLIYLTLSIWLCRSFYKSMMELILMSGADNMNHPSSSSDRSILNVALKLTITPMTALLSTIITEITFFICYPLFSALFGRPGARISGELFTFLFNLDSSINVICLLCSLSKSQSYYDWVFGRVHQYFWNRIVASMENRSDEE